MDELVNLSDDVLERLLEQFSLEEDYEICQAIKAILDERALRCMNTIDKEEVEALLMHDQVKELERAVVQTIGCELHTDDVERITEIVLSEIETSVFTLQDIKDFILAEPTIIIAFAKQLFSDYTPELISFGFSVKFTIYLLYLRNKAAEDLQAYLKAQRIPRRERNALFTRMQEIKNTLSI